MWWTKKPRLNLCMLIYPGKHTGHHQILSWAGRFLAHLHWDCNTCIGHVRPQDEFIDGLRHDKNGSSTLPPHMMIGERCWLYKLQLFKQFRLNSRLPNSCRLLQATNSALSTNNVKKPGVMYEPISLGITYFLASTTWSQAVISFLSWWKASTTLTDHAEGILLLFYFISFIFYTPCRRASKLLPFRTPRIRALITSMFKTTFQTQIKGEILRCNAENASFAQVSGWACHR